MDKKKNPITVRLEYSLEAKLREVARRHARTPAGQIRFYIARGIHEDSFRLEDYCTTVEENGEEK